MSRKLSISEAWAKLPELARRLVKSPGRVEIITHRDLEEDIAMTTSGYIRYLEESVRELRGRAGEFKLAGSMTTTLSDDEIERSLADVRLDASDLAEEKLRNFAP
jgi:hypothetical protein